MHSRHVEIKSPCHENWDAMHGDGARRFCDVCAKHVHNLSEMTREEATDLLQQHKGQHLCVRYANHDDGTIAFSDDPPVIPVGRLRAVRTAFAAVMLAACTPHGDGPPIQELGDVAIEAMARDAVPSENGGCDVRTGPLTTLHFPAGHEVCRYVADQGHRIAPPPPLPPPPLPPQVVEPRVPVQPDPVPMMGAVAPPEQPKMGEAMPEGYKEPCDPKPGFAPPPPMMGQAPVQIVEPPPTPPEPRHELMGDIAVEDIREPPPPPREPRVKMGKVAPSRTGGAVVDDL